MNYIEVTTLAFLVVAIFLAVGKYEYSKNRN